MSLNLKTMPTVTATQSPKHGESDRMGIDVFSPLLGKPPIHRQSVRFDCASAIAPMPASEPEPVVAGQGKPEPSQVLAPLGHCSPPCGSLNKSGASPPTCAPDR